MPEFKPRFTATGIGTLPLHRPRPGGGHGAGPVDRNALLAPAAGPLPPGGHEQPVRPGPDSPAGGGRGGPGAGQPGDRREEALAGFYERLFSGQSAGFGLTEKEAAGFIAFLQRIGRAAPGEFPWVKGHVTGPCTLAASVTGWDGKALLYDDEVAEALARGLGAAAAAQVEQMAPLGRPVLIFFDEPFLSGFGSAFSPISRERVIELLGYSFEETRNRCQAQIGCTAAAIPTGP